MLYLRYLKPERRAQFTAFHAQVGSMLSCNPLGQGKSKTRTRASPSSSGSAARLLGTVKATLEAQAKLSKAQIIVVAGHIHNYQRFFQNGVTYLVSGGGGAKPHPVARTPADLFQDKASPNYHYIRFDFDGSQLNAVMYRLADPKANPVVWEKTDSFVIKPKP